MTTANQSTVTVAAFVEARLAEDEAAAEYARNRADQWADTGYETMAFPTETSGNLVFMADPARVLAEVAAHRKIVELHHDDGDDFHAYCEECGHHSGRPETRAVEWPCPTLRALASTWRDHPEFDAAWSL